MRHVQCFVAALIAAPCLVCAAPPITISDQNSSLVYTTDDPGSNIPGGTSNPVQLPRTLQWTVDGRRILVYPSGPSTFLDISHAHLNAHVAANQIHAQGPMLGYATNAATGTVVGGVVYSLGGGATNSGASRMSEKLDVHNKSGAAVSLSLAGLGFKPTQQSLEVPDFSGLDVTGTTVVYFFGNGTADSFTEPPYAPLTILPVVSFTGFNPLFNQTLSLPAGARMVMITELNVARAPWVLVPVWVWIVLTLALVASASAWALRRRARVG